MTAESMTVIRALLKSGKLKFTDEMIRQIAKEDGLGEVSKDEIEWIREMTIRSIKKGLEK